MHQDHYRMAFEVLLGHDVVNALIDSRKMHDAPFTLDSARGIVISNVAYLGELVVAVLLLFRVTRRRAAVGAIEVIGS